MIRTYGDQAGFGWKLNEIVGAQVVSVPMAVPMQRARVTFCTGPPSAWRPSATRWAG
jgi:hypothetical protein